MRPFNGKRGFPYSGRDDFLLKKRINTLIYDDLSIITNHDDFGSSNNGLCGSSARLGTRGRVRGLRNDTILYRKIMIVRFKKRPFVGAN